MSQAIRNQYPDLFFEDQLPVLEALIMDTFEQQPDFIDKIFNVSSDDKWGVQDVTFAGLEPAQQKAEGTEGFISRPLQGYEKTYKHLEYEVKFKFTETLMEDDRVDLIGRSMKSLGKSAHQTTQILAAAIFNNGFTDTGPDGQSLFSTAHPLIGGGSYGNTPTVSIALSVAGMREMEVDLMRQTDDRGIQIFIKPTKLFVPPELPFVATELTRSEYKPGTANNEVNTFVSNGYEVVVSPYLSSATAWFAMADKSEHMLKWIWRVAPSVRSFPVNENGEQTTRMRFRSSVGYSDYKGVWGSQG
jgi:hypothetical protein